jgi:hypothetical protein
VTPLAWVYRALLTPFGHGVVWLLRVLLVVPVRAVWRYVLAPSWHAAGRVIRLVGRALRDHIWRPAAGVVREAWRSARQALATVRETARVARADVRRALFGAPKAGRSALPEPEGAPVLAPGLDLTKRQSPPA